MQFSSQTPQAPSPNSARCSRRGSRRGSRRAAREAAGEQQESLRYTTCWQLYENLTEPGTPAWLDTVGWEDR